MLRSTSCRALEVARTAPPNIATMCGSAEGMCAHNFIIPSVAGDFYVVDRRNNEVGAFCVHAENAGTSAVRPLCRAIHHIVGCVLRAYASASCVSHMPARTRTSRTYLPWQNPFPFVRSQVAVVQNVDFGFGGSGWCGGIVNALAYLDIIWHACTSWAAYPCVCERPPTT